MDSCTAALGRRVDGARHEQQGHIGLIYRCKELWVGMEHGEKALQGVQRRREA